MGQVCANATQPAPLPATVGWDRWHFTLVRVATNQGLSGYGGVRLNLSATCACSSSVEPLPDQPGGAVC